MKEWKIEPGEARFRPATNPQEKCTTCGYFDPDHRVCLMHVPEANFDEYPASRYTCDYWTKSGPKPK